MPKTFVITKKSPLLQEDVDCNYCHTDLLLDDQVTACDRCGSPHHSDCWAANGNQCATFGCVGVASAVSRAPANQPATPAPATRTRTNTQRYTVAGQARTQSNRRRFFGLCAFVAMIFYTIIFETGAPSMLPNVNHPVSTPAPVASSPLTNSSGSATTAATVSFTNCEQAVGIDPNDCAAIVKLYESTDGPNWQKQNGWLKRQRPCKWHGISCREKRVTHIRLTQNQLYGEVPTGLGKLTALTDLVLSNNQLYGEIPSDLVDLPDLAHINLTNNQLIGEIPRELGQLSKLSGMLLGNNKLRGEVPPELSQLPRLKSLDLESNRLKGVIPRMLACSPLLSSQGYLYINHNRLAAADEETAACLERQQKGWAETQTVAPTNIRVYMPSKDTITLLWTPILYSGGNGYYEVGRSDNGGSSFMVVAHTSSKKESSIDLINELSIEANSTDSNYWYAVRSVTLASADQRYSLISDFSEWVTVQAESE